MEKTIAGLFESSHDAHAAADDLMAKGFSSNDVSIVARKGDKLSTQTGEGESRAKEMGKGAAAGAVTGGVVGGAAGLIAAAAGLAIPGIGPILAAGPLAAALAGVGIGAAAGGIIGALVKMGIPEREAQTYAEGVRRGGTSVTAHTDDDMKAEQAADIMNDHNALDIDRLAQDWKQQGWTGFSEDQAAIPVAQEELKVGKREIERGHVRIYSHVEETPVEQDVSLREQHARVERQPVDRPLSADDDAFKERAYSVKETAEEPVVEKSARVTEEVRLTPETTEREQKIKDTVRHTDVDVQRTGASESARSPRSRYAGPERRRPGTLPYNGPERRQYASM